MSNNDKIGPKEDKTIIRPYEPDITKGYTSSTPPQAPQQTTPAPPPPPNEKK